jgi:hypothetical protein
MNDIPKDITKIKRFKVLYHCPICSEIFSLDDKWVKDTMTIIPGHSDPPMVVVRCPECKFWGSI